MKLDKNIKKQIDSYFANITADDLYDVLTQKYGFTDEEESCKKVAESDDLFVEEDELLYLEDNVCGNFAKAEKQCSKLLTGNCSDESDDNYDSSLPLAA